MTARILVIDDDAVSCELVAEVLAGEGYNIDQVGTGEQAIARVREEAYDLLVVDLQLPKASGLEVMREARNRYPDLPVVIITAFGSMETAVAALRDGAVDYLSKPMEVEDLKHTVS